MAKRRSHSTEYMQIKRQLLENVGKCELCGSSRGLELHHIVPVVCGGSDSPENLILVCKKCHALLTPKSELTRIGLKKAKQGTKFVSAIDFYTELDAYEGDFVLKDVFEVFNRLAGLEVELEG